MKPMAESSNRNNRASALRARRPVGLSEVAVSILWLALLAAKGSAGSQMSAAGLDLQISQVNKLPALDDGKTTEIEVRWTVQVARFVALDSFEVTLEVSYSSGARAVVTSGRLKPSARTSILEVPARSRAQANAEPKGFKAAVKASFKSISSVIVIRRFETAQPGRAPSGGDPVAFPLELDITEARAASHGCPSGQGCVDVKWMASAPRNITIDEFIVTLETTHKDGSQRSASRNAAGSERRARISVGAIASEIMSMKVSLRTDFFSTASKTVTREGAF